MRVFRLALHGEHGLCLVLFREDGLDAEAGLAHKREVETRVLAVAALVAKESIKVLVVDVPAQPALERILAAVPANPVPVGYRTVAPWAQHALRQAGGREFVERRELDHDIRGDDGDGELCRSLDLVCCQLERRKLLPEVPLALQ